MQHITDLTKRDQAMLARDRQNLIYGVLKHGVTCLTVVGAIWLSPGLIVPLAGKETALALNVALFGDIKFMLSVSLTGAAAVWAIVERSLRHRKVEYLQKRITQLETTIDKSRTSSQLTTKGKTNPRDKK